jgi:hypothetical protein
MRRWGWAGLLVAALAPAHAGEKEISPAPEIDESAMEILRNTTGYLTGMDRFRLKAQSKGL